MVREPSGVRLAAWSAAGVVWLLVLGGCGGDSGNTPAEDVADEPDAAVEDVLIEPIDEPAPDLPVEVEPDVTEDQTPIEPRRTGASLTLTGGGGALDSANFQLRLVVAPPVPVGLRESANYTLILGPQAIHP